MRASLLHGDGRQEKRKKDFKLGRTWGQGLVGQHILHGKW
jgi:hypothetical protein